MFVHGYWHVEWDEMSEIDFKNLILKRTTWLCFFIRNVEK